MVFCGISREVVKYVLRISTGRYAQRNDKEGISFAFRRTKEGLGGSRTHLSRVRRRGPERSESPFWALVGIILLFVLCFCLYWGELFPLCLFPCLFWVSLWGVLELGDELVDFGEEVWVE